MGTYDFFALITANTSINENLAYFYGGQLLKVTYKEMHFQFSYFQLVGTKLVGSRCVPTCGVTNISLLVGASCVY